MTAATAELTTAGMRAGLDLGPVLGHGEGHAPALDDARATAPGQWERRAFAWHGLRPSDAVRCPRALAGRQCRQRRLRGWPPARCLCEIYRPAVLDHVRRWRDRDGARVLTAEPYAPLDLDELRDFTEECRRLGLSVVVDRRSPYYPTRTVLVIVRRAIAPL